MRLAMTTSWLLVIASVAGCAMPSADDEEENDGGGGKADGTSRFVEVDPSHSTKSFREYIGKALDQLEEAGHDMPGDGGRLAKATAAAIEAGLVHVDELRDLTCSDFEHVRSDLPDAHLQPEDRATIHAHGSKAAKAIEGELDGYQWGNRIYLSRQMTITRLAATLIHETNHVLNRSEIGYYDDLPSSAFVHEYRAFYAESLYDKDEWDGTDIVDYVVTEYDLDRDKLHPELLAHPLTPILIPTKADWDARDVESDVEEVPDVCQ
jgi:hypothetical protein